MMQPIFSKPVTITATLCALCLLFSVRGYATSLMPLDLDAVTDRAELIIHATVNSQQTVFDDASQRVVTITHFDIIDTLKGNASGRHSIKQIGGRLPGATHSYRVHGVPQFVNGMEYVVFLPAVSRLGFSSPVGLSQGKFDIEIVDGVKTVHGSGASDAHTAHRPALPGGPEHGATRLEVFKQRVMERIAR